MARPRSLTAALVVIIVAAVPLGSGPAEADTNKIQPGDVAYVSEGQCTLNFVFDGPGGKTYIGTAAHCVDKVGDAVATSQYGDFGEVAWIGDADETELDFAFIEVWSQFEDAIDPSVRGHPDYPIGYTIRQDTIIGDKIQISGYGVGYDLTYPTQTKRFGIHFSDNEKVYRMDGLDTWGDSGGPLVHVYSGKAYGIVSRACIDICTSTGPTVEGMLALAAEDGFAVTLRTV